MFKAGSVGNQGFHQRTLLTPAQHPFLPDAPLVRLISLETLCYARVQEPCDCLSLLVTITN